MNLYDQCQSDGIVFKKNSSTKGGVYTSGCPSCGGTDRFVVWPNQGKNGQYWCRGCGIKGNLIQYLRDFKGMSFPEACKYSGNDDLLDDNYSFKSQPVIKPYEWQPKLAKNPNELWMERASSMVDYAKNMLRSDAGRGVREWLNKDRCLKDTTIKRFNLGLLERNYFPKMDTWGLEEILKDDGTPKKLFLPEGLVIPFIRYRKVLRLRIRRTNPGEYSKYYIVSGSSMYPFRTRYFDEKTAIIVESELDAILLSQEIKEDVLIIALGAVRIPPDKKLTDILNDMDHILIALDNDAAGIKGYNDFWKINFPRSVQHNISDGYGKDPTEAMLSGLDLYKWYLNGIERSKKCVKPVSNI